MVTAQLTPHNEGQELNYIESVRGTPADIVQRARIMRNDLAKALPLGSFTVKIEAGEHTVWVYKEGIYNEDLEPLPDIHLLNK